MHARTYFQWGENKTWEINQVPLYHLLCIACKKKKKKSYDFYEEVLGGLPEKVFQNKTAHANADDASISQLLIFTHYKYKKIQKSIIVKSFVAF